MACRALLNTVTLSSQFLAVGDKISFSKNNILFTNQIGHTEGSQYIYFCGEGVYYISLDVNITSATAETVTVQMYNKDVPIGGAIISLVLAANTAQDGHLSFMLRVPKSCACINNNAAISFSVSAAATVNSSVLNVVKL